MKGVIKIISLTMGLILLFSAGLLAGTYALAAVPAAEKEYEVDRFTDGSLFVKNESGPARQSDMQDKFENYNTLENGIFTFFTPEQAEELHDRKENGELFTLSYDEVLFIINDSIRQYYNHDEIVLTKANEYGLIPEEKRQRSSDYHVYCYHGDCSEFSFEQAKYRYQDILNDLYCIIVYRLSMLDSSFARCEQYVTDDMSRWLIVDGQSPAVLVSGEGEYGIESINVDPPIPEKTFYLKSFAEADELSAIREITADEYGIFFRKESARVSPWRSDIYEEWYNASLEAPLLIADFENKNNSIIISQTDGLILSTVFPTVELKEKAPVYDPTKEFNDKYDRTMSELMAKDLMPDYDLSMPTPAYPLKYYKDGVDADGNGLREGMTFKEMVEEFGLPYNGLTSGMFTLTYYTEDGYTILVYIGKYTKDDPDGYYVQSIRWPAE